MSTARWACLALLVLSGAAVPCAHAAAPGGLATGKMVQLDVALVRAEPGTARSLMKSSGDWGALRGEHGAVFGLLATPGQTSRTACALERLENQGHARALARPRVVARSGVPCQVGVGAEEFATRVDFLPTALSNGRIHLEVELEASHLDQNAGVVIAGTIVPGRYAQRIHTTRELGGGQALVIGMPYFKPGTTETIPVLGELPFVGQFFTHRTKDRWHELIVLVTPRLVDNPAHSER